ncbi:pyridoxal-dependent decarboxylase domain protein [Trichinella nativa]|uniref:Aromatic-L-amino-acid decarboxylase n=1 Tax=Trichinella nativa TaxID=6335 RepID=A0A1Y3E7F1_9BILA|nr:pyridoxal-dependent decarboxylase domain protein [Trichinella nativa]
MDAEEFRKWGKKMIDFVADYWINLPSRTPMSDVKPGYLRSLLPEEAPMDPDSWENIFSDIETVILQGNSSPACTELEMVMMDWLAKLLKLPEYFLYSHSGPGAGMIQGTASECVLFSMLAAKNKTCKKYESENKQHHICEKDLIAYCSDQAHSSVERAAMLAHVQIRKVPSDENYRMTRVALQAVCATLGTTNSCAFDCLTEIGLLCKEKEIWLHIDAAYAGSAFICPEYRHLLDGIEYADTFNFNPHKALMINFDCSAMWFKNVLEIENAYYVDPQYLKHEHQNMIPDFRMCRLAKEFADFVVKDERFELVAPVILGLVCFRLKDTNEVNEKLYQLINNQRRIHVVSSVLKNVFVLRISISSALTETADIYFAWKVISASATKLLASY